MAESGFSSAGEGGTGEYLHVNVFFLAVYYSPKVQPFISPTHSEPELYKAYSIDYILMTFYTRKGFVIK